MSVRLCDGDIFVVSVEGLEKGELLQFFLDGHRDDILLLQDENGRYEGIITYLNLLFHTSINEAVTREKLILGEKGFWHKANELFEEDKDKVIPVFSSKMELCYFAKWDRELEPIWKKYSNYISM